MRTFLRVLGCLLLWALVLACRLAVADAVVPGRVRAFALARVRLWALLCVCLVALVCAPLSGGARGRVWVCGRLCITAHERTLRLLPISLFRLASSSDQCCLINSSVPSFCFLFLVPVIPVFLIC